jgi:intracellular sulfur oxidation DsrE/DsrF family protein
MPSKSRRQFLSRLGVAATAAGTTLAAGPAAQAPAAADGRFQPARHPQDDWLDQLPGKHRLFFDSTKPDSLEDAIQFAGNFYSANRRDYKLENSDLAVVICMRHRAAPFGYNDAIWAKYGATLSRRAEFTDPKTKEALKVNYFTPVAPAAPARPRGLASLMRLGVQFGVCNLSTHAIASMIAGEIGGKADDIYKELAANLIDKARLVPAGIVAMSRAQEKGYAITGG